MRVRFGSFYFDAIDDDSLATRPILVNRVPERLEADVPIDAEIAFDLVDPGAAGMAAVTQITVSSIPVGGLAPIDVLAYDQATGTWHADYLAGSSLTTGSSPGSGVLDEQHVRLVRNWDWTSGETITISVEAETADGVALTAKAWTFTIEDVRAPAVDRVSTRGLRVLRVTFSEPVDRSSGTSGDATRVREITGGISFLNSPNRIEAVGGEFAAADVGSFIGTVGCDDVRGDGYYRVLAVDSAAVVQVEAAPYARFLPFADEVTGPNAVVGIGPYRLASHRQLTPWGSPGGTNGFGPGVSLGEHDLVLLGPLTFPRAEWFWLDDGTGTYGWLRAVVRDLDEIRTMYFGADDSTTYDAAALAAAAASNASAITVTYATANIVVAVSGAPAASFRPLRTYGSDDLAQVGIAEPAFVPVIVSARAVEVDEVPTTGAAEDTDETRMVELELSSELTAEAPYVLFVSNVEDLSGNEIAIACEAYDNLAHRSFDAEPHPTVEGRSFSLYNMLPEANRAADIDRSLARFLAVRQEVVDLLLAEISRFTELWDIDLAPTARLDTLLDHLGNPFTFAYDSEALDKRKLIAALTRIYARNGVEIGMEATLTLFFGSNPLTGAVWDVVPCAGLDGWELDVDLLDLDAYLGPDGTFQIYAFEVHAPFALTDAQRLRVQAIVEYMKPAHTHYIRLVEP